MSNGLRIVLLVLLVLVVGAGVLVATADLSPPTQKVEKVIPDDRFKK